MPIDKDTKFQPEFCYTAYMPVTNPEEKIVLDLILESAVKPEKDYYHVYQHKIAPFPFFIIGASLFGLVVIGIFLLIDTFIYG